MAEPAWLSSPPKEDAEFFYYIGRSEDSTSEVRARKEAFTNAYEQAIQENFGFEAGIDSSEYQSDLDSKTVKNNFLSSRKIEFKDFQIVDSFLNREGRLYNVAALYRYRKSSVLEAKAKLKENPKLNLNEFSVTGEENKISLGGLEITTKPFGARVFIDNEPFSRTPVRIVGQLKPGTHVITIDHPKFQIIEEHVHISAGRITKLNKILEPAFGTIHLDSEPRGAEVYYNNKQLSMKTPMQLPSIPAGREFALEFRKEGFHTQVITDLKVERGATRVVKVRLTSTSNYVTPSTYELETSVPNYVTEETQATKTSGAFIFAGVMASTGGSPLKSYENLHLSGAAVNFNLLFPSYFGFTFTNETGNASSVTDLQKTISIKSYQQQRISLWLVNSMEVSEGAYSIWQLGLEQVQSNLNLSIQEPGRPELNLNPQALGTGFAARWVWISKESRSVFTFGGGVTQYTSSQDKTSSLVGYMQIGFGISLLRDP